MKKKKIVKLFNTPRVTPDPGAQPLILIANTFFINSNPKFTADAATADADRVAIDKIHTSDMRDYMHRLNQPNQEVVKIMDRLFINDNYISNSNLHYNFKKISEIDDINYFDYIGKKVKHNLTYYFLMTKTLGDLGQILSIYKYNLVNGRDQTEMIHLFLTGDKFCGLMAALVITNQAVTIPIQVTEFKSQDQMYELFSHITELDATKYTIYSKEDINDLEKKLEEQTQKLEEQTQKLEASQANYNSLIQTDIPPFSGNDPRHGSKMLLYSPSTPLQNSPNTSLSFSSTPKIGKMPIRYSHDDLESNNNSNNSNNSSNNRSRSNSLFSYSSRGGQMKNKKQNKKTRRNKNKKQNKKTRRKKNKKTRRKNIKN
jgi:hypothetical protein